jgi:hypothetical protein
MAGDVNESNPQIFSQVQVSEAQIDGDAAALFFFPAVRVYPRERQDQRRFPVIDVSRGSHDDVFHGIPFMR